MYLSQTFLNTYSILPNIPYQLKTVEDSHTPAPLYSCFPSVSGSVLVPQGTREAVSVAASSLGNYGPIRERRPADEALLIANSIAPHFSLVFKHTRLFLMALYMV